MPHLVLAAVHAAFGAAAWQTAPRDQFIGWNHDQRKKNLNLIINNARFLILPWVQSKILSLIACRLPDDWEEKYNVRPVLLESFVQKNLFAGTYYKAANWIDVGQTKGRGKLGPPGKLNVPIKDIWVYPLAKRFRFFLRIDSRRGKPNIYFSSTFYQYIAVC